MAAGYYFKRYKRCLFPIYSIEYLDNSIQTHRKDQISDQDIRERNCMSWETMTIGNAQECRYAFLYNENFLEIGKAVTRQEKPIR